jgi:hypothetical protein
MVTFGNESNLREELAHWFRYFADHDEIFKDYNRRLAPIAIRQPEGIAG